MAAERIKCEYGTAVTAGVSKADIIEVPSVGGRPPRVLSKMLLAEIIEPRTSEMFALIQREIIKAGCEDMLTSGVVLTGGSANLPGIAQVAEHVFNLPVRVGVPAGIGGLLDLIKGPEYSGAVGLVLHGATQGPLSRRSGPVARGRVGSAMRRVAGWFSEHF
jgi:cell division protein FtsA